MGARVIDGAAIARSVLQQLRPRATALAKQGMQPGLAAVHVGDSAASKLYLRNKVRACTEVGVHSEVHTLDAAVTEADVMALVESLNRDSRVHGIIVQLPLPRTFNATRILQSIAIEKDVDGFNWRNLGALVDAQPQLVPCTPLGVMAMLDHAGVPLVGRHAVVVGRSSIVGKPMALLLISRDATVTVCNSKTPDLGEFTRGADVLVAAAGRARLITADMVAPGAAVIDVGINRTAEGKLVGDVDYASVERVAGWISPVPGGVGPMTVAMLIANTVTAAERFQQ
jgi:methylenetetrahydrofolate dehydrogenase (NADP+) / methenyltetrahydrofolate cyclohydrolase